MVIKFAQYFYKCNRILLSVEIQEKYIFFSLFTEIFLYLLTEIYIFFQKYEQFS